MNAGVAWLSSTRKDRQILRAAGAVTGVGLIVKLTATLKEFTVAGVYGRSDAMDAFLAAALIPGLLINLIAESMNQALLPTLVRVTQFEGQDRAQKLLSNAMAWSCLLLLGASIAMALATPLFFPVVASHFPAEKLKLAEHLFYGLLPVVVLAGIASNCTAVLNTQNRFVLPALAPVVTPLLTIAFALWLSPRLGIWSLVCATVAGALVLALWMAGLMHRNGYRFQMHWSGRDDATREVAHQYGAVLLSSVVASGGLLVDQSMAAMLPAGSVSALVYANRFVSVVVTLLAGSLAAVITPHFARLVASHAWLECRQAIRRWIAWTAFLTIPITAALICGSSALIRLTFQHGVFGPHDTKVVTPVLMMYALQIPFFVCSRVYYRFLLAMRRSDLIFYCGLLNLGLDIVLNYALMDCLGVAGIALATSLWTVSTFLFLRFWTLKLLNAVSGVNA